VKAIRKATPHTATRSPTAKALLRRGRVIDGRYCFSNHMER
jgi:hypothetical protein